MNAARAHHASTPYLDAVADAIVAVAQGGGDAAAVGDDLLDALCRAYYEPLGWDMDDLDPDDLRDCRSAMEPVAAFLAARTAALRAERDDLRAKVAAVEALIGGPDGPPVFLSDRPNKIVRVQHRNDRLAATITESMVKVDDLRAALTGTPSTDERGAE